MISKSQINYIKSLHTKKFRNIHSVFLVEGIKSTLEFVQSSYQVLQIYTLPEFLPQLHNLGANIQIFEISKDELFKISTLQHPQGVLAVVKMQPVDTIQASALQNKFSIMLDNVQDPGNMGTILRTADWFGIDTLICSLGTVDVYNSKVVQASMGSLCRVKIFYTDLVPLLLQCEVPTYATVFGGQNMYQTRFGAEGILILGNEGNGISQEVQERADYGITIPNLGHAESLNVAICASICCAEIRRDALVVK